LKLGPLLEAMAESEKKTDDQKFNETLKRMLETPPKPYEKAAPKKESGDKAPPLSPVKKRG
jgi:hypothetical protein